MIKENLNRPQGKVTCKYIDANGNILKTQTTNLVVNKGLQLIGDILINPTIARTLNTLFLGNNGLVFGADTSSIPAPTITDTHLVNSFFSTQATSSNSTPGTNQQIITLVFNVLTSQANNSNPTIVNNLFTEIGLGTSDGSYLFARAILIGTKTPVIALNITWEIFLG